MTHWLQWQCGTNIGAAREKVRVARALPELPKISASFSEGRISYSKVRAMTRVATPKNEEYLWHIAHHIQHWADGGETSMNNLVLLCRRHHLRNPSAAVAR